MLPERKFFRSYAKTNNIPWQQKNILREYLQTQTIKTLSAGKFNQQISFLGGTCLRFAFKIQRFSEDLDFDLIEKKDFNLKKIEKDLKSQLRNMGFEIDTKTKTTENIHIIFLKFKNILKEFGLSNIEDQRLKIKFEIDFNPLKNIRTETKLIENFNERFPLLINTLPTLFAQKIIALKFRPYQKGRDFYDLVWFLAQKELEPNYKLLQEKKLKINNRKQLVKELKNIIDKSDLKQASKDVERFLFYPEQAEWILKLPKFIDDYKQELVNPFKSKV